MQALLILTPVQTFAGSKGIWAWVREASISNTA